jgi:curli production assembly/transport component CsgG
MKNYLSGCMRIGLIATLSVALSACTDLIQPMSSSKPSLNYQSRIASLLRSLPPPREPIVVAVYRFRDETGQYKGSETLTQYSTAVTQGGVSMLIKALMEAGNGKWFKILEREGLTDLMNERKIITQTRQMYINPQDKTSNQSLPPLLYAPILLEGGITAYETNLLTGGIAAHYFGAGGSTEFRRDAVTTMLRAVSVKNGQVLTHTDARKIIFSMQLDSGLFRYVSFKKLLEAEAGFSSNEPPQMAVMEAIESSVYGLIMEGIINQLWSFDNKTLVKPLINAYLEENNSDMVAQFDAQGQLIGVVAKSSLLPVKE